MWGPLGNGFPDLTGVDHVALIAGGIGQTPFLAHVRDLLGQRGYGGRLPGRQCQQVSLFYGVRTADLAAGVDDFGAAGARVHLASNDGSLGFRGFVTQLLEQHLGPAGARHLVGCGPEPMLRRSQTWPNATGCRVTFLWKLRWPVAWAFVSAAWRPFAPATAGIIAASVSRGRFSTQERCSFDPRLEPPMSLYFPTPGECANHTVFPGVTLQTCAADKMMMSLAKLEPDSVVAEHSHPHEQVGMVLEGRVTFHIGGESKTLEPGDMFRIPGNVKHRVVALDQGAKVLDIFCPVREDYR